MHAPLPCTCVWEVKFDKGTRPDLNIWYISIYKRADTFCDKPVEVGQIHLSFCGYHVTRFFKSSCVNVLSTVSSSSGSETTQHFQLQCRPARVFALTHWTRTVALLCFVVKGRLSTGCIERSQWKWGFSPFCELNWEVHVSTYQSSKNKRGESPSLCICSMDNISLTEFLVWCLSPELCPWLWKNKYRPWLHHIFHE